MLILAWLEASWRVGVAEAIGKLETRLTALMARKVNTPRPRRLRIELARPRRVVKR